MTENLTMTVSLGPIPKSATVAFPSLSIEAGGNPVKNSTQSIILWLTRSDMKEITDVVLKCGHRGGGSEIEIAPLLLLRLATFELWGCSCMLGGW
jgi:hypothetical protein